MSKIRVDPDDGPQIYATQQHVPTERSADELPRWLQSLQPLDDEVPRWSQSAEPLSYATSTDEVVETTMNEITLVDNCGGVGFVSHSLQPLGYKTVAYSDINEKSAKVFSQTFRDVTMHDDIRTCQRNTEFMTAAKSADVAFAGPPCSQHSVLNTHRDERSETSELIFDSLSQVVHNQNKIGVFEVVPNFLNADGGSLFAQFCAQASATHSVVPVRMDPRDHGGVQTRERWYLLAIRHDIARQHGPFRSPLKTCNSKVIGDFLDPVAQVNLSELQDTRTWVRRWNTKASNSNYTGPHSDFVLPVQARTADDCHFMAYATDGQCPTLTQTPLVICDQRFGDKCVFRRCSNTEFLRLQGWGSETIFPAGHSNEEVTKSVGLGMEMNCLRALGKSIENYLTDNFEPEFVNNAMVTQNTDLQFTKYGESSNACYTDAATWHLRLNHPSDEVTKQMGYPVCKLPCKFRAEGKSRKATSKTDPIPKGEHFGDKVHIDIKVSSVADRHGNCRRIGFVDTFTNRSWTKVMCDGTTDSCKKCIKEWLVHDIGNKPVNTFVFDNDPAFTSEEMNVFLSTECSPPINKTFSAAYHQHQNGVAEHLWARLNPLTIIMLRAAPWLGTDFWGEAMDYANECVARRPCRANPDNQVPGAMFRGVKTVRTDHLRQWGCVVYVHDDDAKGFQVKAKKGYLIGSARWHADGVYDVYMVDTKRVRKTMNAVFMEHDNISPDKMPDEVIFDLTSSAHPMPQHESLIGTPFTKIPADHLVPSKIDSGSNGQFPMPKVVLGVPGSVPVNEAKCQFPLNAIIVTGDLKSTTSKHGIARCKALHGKTVHQALSMQY